MTKTDRIVNELCRNVNPNFSRNVHWNADPSIEADWLCGKPVGRIRGDVDVDVSRRSPPIKAVTPQRLTRGVLP